MLATPHLRQHYTACRGVQTAHQHMPLTAFRQFLMYSAYLGMVPEKRTKFCNLHSLET